jgi:hypothetical protein
MVVAKHAPSSTVTALPAVKPTASACAKCGSKPEVNRYTGECLDCVMARSRVQHTASVEASRARLVTGKDLWRVRHVAHPAAPPPPRLTPKEPRAPKPPPVRRTDAERTAAATRAIQRHRARHPDKYAAREAVTRALRQGLLVREPCVVCRDERSHAHHHSYAAADQLSVTWVCVVHHRNIHGDRDHPLNPDRRQA